jgi:hypothetical protein
MISGARTTHRLAIPYVPSGFCGTMARHHGRPGTSTPRLTRIAIQRPACPSKNPLRHPPVPVQWLTRGYRCLLLGDLPGAPRTVEH